MQPVYVPTDPHEKAMQRALIQYRDPKNYALVHEALEKVGRTDLIGFDKRCLIRPRKGETVKATPVKQEKRQPPKPQKAQKQQKPTNRREKPQQGNASLTAAQLAKAERYLKSRKKR